LNVCTDRYVWWARKVEQMKDTKNPGNICRLSHSSTGPRKPPVSETTRDQNGSLIPSKEEGFDRWAQYFEATTQSVTCYLKSGLSAFNRKADCEYETPLSPRSARAHIGSSCYSSDHRKTGMWNYNEALEAKIITHRSKLNVAWKINAFIIAKKRGLTQRSPCRHHFMTWLSAVCVTQTRRHACIGLTLPGRLHHCLRRFATCHMKKLFIACQSHTNSNGVVRLRRDKHIYRVSGQLGKVFHKK
ncbi:hypothetical protein CLF_109265, partial [Clonorchis sinensis]